MIKKFGISKTANVILVYQYNRIKEYQYTSRVISHLMCSLLYKLAFVSDFVTPLGKPIEKRESLDSRGWLGAPAQGEMK